MKEISRRRSNSCAAMRRRGDGHMTDMTIATHIMIALVDQRVIATTTSARRTYAQVVTRVGEKYGLLSHGMSDNHAHFVTACDRRRAGTCAQAIEHALHQKLGLSVSFSKAHFKDVRDQPHLRSLIPYVHRQAQHHGVDVDPFFDASSLPDLVGAREMGGGYLRQRLAALAPRVRLLDLVPASMRRSQLPTAPTIEQVAQAAAAAIGVPTLDRGGHSHRAARTAALAVAQPVSRERASDALRCSVRTVKRLARETPDAALVSAVSMQLRWRFGREEVVDMMSA
jgi:hypothetical protein